MNRYNWLSLVRMTRPRCGHWWIPNGRSCNVEAWIVFSWLFPSRSIFVQWHIFLTMTRSLGPLNYIRIWHDNDGSGSSASWFLKYIIVRDLQTEERSYFICQQWLAVEKDDGRVSTDISLAVYSSAHFNAVDWTGFTHCWWWTEARFLLSLLQTSLS